MVNVKETYMHLIYVEQLCPKTARIPHKFDPNSWGGHGGYQENCGIKYDRNNILYCAIFRGLQTKHISLY